MSVKQFVACMTIGILLLALIIRLVQKRRLEIAYCWLWLTIGMGIVILVTHYHWLQALSELLGAETHTTTLFLLGFVVVLLLCLQFSLAISAHRRQIKKLTQDIALLTQNHGSKGEP